MDLQSILDDALSQIDSLKESARAHQVAVQTQTAINTVVNGLVALGESTPDLPTDLMDRYPAPDIESLRTTLRFVALHGDDDQVESAQQGLTSLAPTTPASTSGVPTERRTEGWTITVDGTPATQGDIYSVVQSPKFGLSQMARSIIAKAFKDAVRSGQNTVNVEADGHSFVASR